MAGSGASSSASEWRPGSKLLHPFSPELGVGVVREVEGRYLHVEFPDAGREVTLAAEGGGLVRLVLRPGARARILATDEVVEIAASVGHRYRLSDGREVEDAALWPLVATGTPLERLAALRLDPLDSFRNRLDGLALMQLREAGGLGSFLGGRIELFPHQLHTALRAVERDPVRWLLADEVGLGKTVEACLVLSALVRTGRAQRALVVAPSTLTIQWLGELYRKFHQVFVLLDRARIDSVEGVYGEGVNPFEVHPFAVASLEMLASDARLLELAAEAELDLVVVDEAHRLVRAAVAESLGPLVRHARHALLLTATPPQADRRGFHQLLAQLHPEAFADFGEFTRAVDAGRAVIPCTSAVRREDVGGFPPRVPVPVEVGPPEAPVRRDPRARWLAARARAWARRREKALVFVRAREELELLAHCLEAETGTRVAVFHEGLSAARRDLEVAAFRESTVPLLLCSEAGAEGRNFQFCDRMLHWDLPPDPVELEQRIGRLDRIGRTRPVEIVYFRQEGAEPDLARLYERLDLFARPAAGLDPALAPVQSALEDPSTPIDVEGLVAAVEAARARGPRDVVRVFYPDAYTPEQARAILERVPPDLEERTRVFCVGAAEDLGLECVEKGGAGLYYLELGTGSTVDALPGVPGGARYLGTFDRAEAVAREELEFFASGHPLVEGLLLELEDSPRGRAACLELPEGTLAGAGLLCLFKDGAHWEARVVDAEGRPRSGWVAPVLAALPAARDLRAALREAAGAVGEAWAARIEAAAASVRGPGELVAAAWFESSRA